MAMRQYIGARYVPKFTGTYNPTQAYEALTVVDNGMGTSYISKVPTPAGTPLTDTDYWAIYGATSGAIINLQNQIDAINTDLVVLNTLPRNILIIGNSFVDNGVANALAAEFVNAYKYTGSGTGFGTYTGHASTFEDQLDAAIADSAFDNDTITDVLFVSAMGDTRARTENFTTWRLQLTTSLNSIKNKIALNFPNCVRKTITFAECRNVAYFADNKYKALFDVHRDFKVFAPEYGFEYIGWSGWIAMFEPSYVMSDNFHPNTDGARAIGAQLQSSYHGTMTYRPLQTDAACPFKYADNGTITVILSFTPEHVNLQCRNTNMTTGDPVTYTANSPLIDLSALAYPLPPCREYNMIVWGRIIRVSSGIEDDILQLQVGGEDANGCGTIKAVNAMTSATVGASLLTIPALNCIDYIL